LSLPPRDHPAPDGWIVVVQGLPQDVAARAADQAALLAREMAPKVSGRGALGLRPAFGEDWFGIFSRESYMQHVNNGTRPRVMTELAGKTIPMWLNDPDGSMTERIPLAKRAQRTRTTADGRRQVLIFRKAAPIGSTRMVQRRGRMVMVPRHYPGAPGRRDVRTGRFGGVWWRHPGIHGRQFAEDALLMVADRLRLDVADVYPSKIGA